MNINQLYKGVTRPSIEDVIQVDNRRHDISQVDEVRFMMRYAESATLKINKPATNLDDGSPAKRGMVRYDPEPEDVDTVAEFFAWWRVIDGTAIQDTPEYYLPVDEHSPGRGVEFGAIADRVRGYMPSTFDGLSRWPAHGDRRLQDTIEKVKLQILNTTISTSAEAGLNLLVQSYIAKKVALELIPAGRDYWLMQVQSMSSNDPDSAESYPDRIRALSDLQMDLQVQIARDEIDVLPLIPTAKLRSDGPKTSEPKVARVTGDPNDFPPYGTFPCNPDRVIL